MPTAQRCELLLFIACFFAFAYFNQGGGWNQNARFAEVRAMAEQGRFAIDDYLVYQRDPESDDLVRLPLNNAEYEWEGRRHRLCWVDMEWNFFPVGEHPLGEGVVKAAMVERCSSGDIGYVPQTGHFHPNKPPGTSFAALPGYLAIYHVERMLGINPDHWWTLNVNAWLMSIFSVGLGAALGCVLFFRLARDFAGGAVLPALCATLTFAFGTTFFPFSTLLFDHALTAALLISTLYFLRKTKAGGAGEAERKHRHRPEIAGFIAGLCAGFAVLTNYVAIGAVGILGLYALSYRQAPAGLPFLRRLDWRSATGFAVGGLGPFLLLCWYGYVCYGSPLRPGTDFQNPLFQNSGAFLGMFSIPRSSEDFWRIMYVAQLLAYSPFRGLFWFSPVLLLGLVGLVVWLLERRLSPEARVCIAIFGFFYVVNVTFNGFHAGFSAGPRYLIPGLPFLALPLVVAFARWRVLTGILASLSVAIHLLLTATDAQNPVGVGGHARVEGRHSEWTYDLLGEYAWPLFTQGRAWPLLRAQMEIQLDKQEAQLDEEELYAGAREGRREALRAKLVESIQRGEPSPFLLGSIAGPISVNPIGAFEGLLTYGFYRPGTPQVEWASFNLGELFWPRSRVSLLPLLLIGAGLSAWALALARRADDAIVK